MKKFSKVLALCLVTVFAALALVACAPNSNPEKAKANLDDKGYAATILKYDGGVLSSGLIWTTTLALGCKNGDIEYIVSGTKIGEDKTDTVTVIYFKDASTAKNLWDKAQEKYGKSESGDESDWVIDRSGKMIYYGTKDAVKATY